MFNAAARKIMAVLSVMFLLFSGQACTGQAPTGSTKLRVEGAVKNQLNLTLENLKNMPPFQIKNIVRVEEKASWDEPEKESGTDSYRGVLLRDILDKAGMKHVRKWEPGVYVRVKGLNQEEAVFSFGEIFYSSVGRGALIAYEKSGRPIRTDGGLGELVVATDARAGRFIIGVQEIIIERANIPMIAYEDKDKNIIRPTTSSLSIVDHRAGSTWQFGPDDLAGLPQVVLHNTLMAGDCEGFNGLYTFEGPLLRSLLEWVGLTWANRDYSRFVIISSEDGFCAAFSIGELYNSRLDNNIIIAGKRNGAPLGSRGFAASAVGEDSMGGRSVKRINKIEIF